MPHPHPDRNLILGLAALERGLITRETLAAALRAWSEDPGRPLTDVLVAQGVLSLADRDTLESSLDEAGTTGANGAGQRFVVLQPHTTDDLARVSVARDAEMNREVALKELLPQHADDPTRLARFLLEGEITASLEHPGILPVYALGRDASGRPFFATRLVHGEPLKNAIEQSSSPASLRPLLRRFLDACNAVAYAHSRGVIHRNLSPLSILLGKHGETVVTDWRQARVGGNGTDGTVLQPASAEEAGETLTGAGASAYISPERAAGRIDQVGPKSDVYSLGAVLYHVLTGKPPVEGKDDYELLKRVQNGEFKRPRAVNPAIPVALEAVCLKAMAFKPEQRYESVTALADDVERWLVGQPVSVWREPVSARFGAWAGRHPLLITSVVGLLLIAALVSIAGYGYMADQYRGAKAAREVAEGQASAAARARDETMARAEDALRQATAERAAREDVENQRAETTRLKTAAEDEAKKAVARAEANRAQLVRRHVAMGNRLVEDGDPMGALAWFAEAMLLDRDHPDREPIHRARLATTLRQCPRVLHTIVGSGDRAFLDVSRDGNLILFADPGKDSLRILDSYTGEDSVPSLQTGPVTQPPRFSPDGRFFLVTADVPGNKPRTEISVWDQKERKTAFKPDRVDGVGRFFGFTPNGSHLLAVTEREADGMTGAQVYIHRYEIPTGDYATAKGPRDGSGAVAAISPDGSRFVAGVEKVSPAGERHGEVQVWDFEKLASTGPVMTHEDRLTHVAFSPDGALVLVAGGKQARVWEAATGKALSPILRHGSAIEVAEFSRDGKQVRTLAAGELHVWDASKGQLESVTRTMGRAGLGINPDGRTFVTTDRGPFLRLWDGATGQARTPLLRHPGEVIDARFTPDGRRLLTGSKRLSAPGYETRIWDVEAGKPKTPVNVGGQRFAPGWVTPNGQRVLIHRPLAPNHLLDIATGEFTPLPAGKRFLLASADFSTDSKSVATVMSGAKGPVLMRVWDTNSGQPQSPEIDVKVDETEGQPGSKVRVRLSGDGKTVLTLAEKEKKESGLSCELQAWDVEDGKAKGPAFTFPTAASFVNLCIDFMPGNRGAIVVENGKAHVVDLEMGKEAGPPLAVKDAKAPAAERALGSAWGMPQLVAFSPDGTRMALATGGESAQLFDVETLKPAEVIIAHQGAIDHVAFSADGKRLVTASLDRTARVWDAATGKPLSAPMAHAGRVSRATFGPEGRLVATASDDGTARVWDATTGEPVSPPLSAGGVERRPVKSVLFSSDGKRLITSPEHVGDMAIWDVSIDERPVEDLVRVARAVSGQKLDAQGNMAALPAEEMRNEWKAVRTQFAKDFALKADDVHEWHDEQLGECLRANDRAAAEFHLDRMILAAPGTGGLYVVRGELHGEMGAWRKAAYDFAKAIDLEGDQEVLASRLALAQLLGAGEKDYRKICAALVEKLQKTEKPGVATSVAWGCVYAPGALEDMDAAIKLAQQGVGGNVFTSVPWTALGCVQYRAGKYADAVKSLQTAVGKSDGGKVPADWFFLAMAYHHLGNADKAKEALKKGQDLVKEIKSPKPAEVAHFYRISWTEAQEMEMFQKEAEAELKKEPMKKP